MSSVDLEKIFELRRQIHIKHNITSTNDELVGEIDKIIKSIEHHIKSSSIEKSINWTIYKDKWLKNEDNKLQGNFYNYERGDIILSLDLGIMNIGTEIRYPHPCVVLYDNQEDWVIVAPITAAQKNRETGEIIIHEFEVFVEAQSKKPKNDREFHFKKQSVIQVDQLHRVSKHRAVNKKRMKLRGDLLNQIDNIMIEKYIPKKHMLLEKMKNLNIQQYDEINELLEVKKELEDEVKIKDDYIAVLENKIKQMEEKMLQNIE